jgi:hypothetical protein
MSVFLEQKSRQSAAACHPVAALQGYHFPAAVDEIDS